MDEEKLARDLKQEGFGHTYVWQDAPNASYPDHARHGNCAPYFGRGDDTDDGWPKPPISRRRTLRRTRWSRGLRGHGPERLPVSDWRALKRCVSPGRPPSPPFFISVHSKET
jgi:hypothetical protein